VRIYNERGDYLARAVISDKVKPGVVVSPSIWWRKLSPDGRNVNQTTSQAITDMGEGATFYDNLVEVEPFG
jgi:anaerobic selenocysteine-containing dehydrogenase